MPRCRGESGVALGMTGRNASWPPCASNSLTTFSEKPQAEQKRASFETCRWPQCGQNTPTFSFRNGLSHFPRGKPKQTKRAAGAHPKRVGRLRMRELDDA